MIKATTSMLAEVFDMALPGARSIITRFTKSNNNLDNPFRQIVEAAGLAPWPKLFQNLRASCETQWLKQGERADLVANWIGHSVVIQNRNYIQHTDEDIQAFNAKTSFSGGRKVAHQMAHQVAH